MIAWPLYLSFLGALAMGLVRRPDSPAPRRTALGVSLAGLAIALVAVLRQPPGAEPVTLLRRDWIPSLGASLHLAADGLSATLVLLTALASVAGVLFSWNVRQRPREFFALYLLLIGAMHGVFLSWDLLLFFVFYELAIVPKYLLIAFWGSTRRDYAAMKLALYSFLGSAAVLAGIVVLAAGNVPRSLDLSLLAQYPMPDRVQAWAFPLLFGGFAVLAGLWPFHTWAPTGHVAAPTAASMLLAGVIMKLGAYGCLRIALPLMPEGARDWRFVFGMLSVIGILWGALVALRQRDFKFVIGYSSVSHMGFVLLGLAAGTPLALSGAVFQMVSHGILAGLLFGVVGRMVYDRTHTRDLAELSRFRLARTLPGATLVFVIAGLASMGLPGFSGFIAEVQVLLGTWPLSGRFVALAGLGILLGVAYTLRVIHQAFFAADEAPAEAILSPGAPLTLPERIGAALLIAATLGLGLYPRILLDWIQPVLAGPHFEGLRRTLGT